MFGSQLGHADIVLLFDEYKIQRRSRSQCMKRVYQDEEVRKKYQQHIEEYH